MVIYKKIKKYKKNESLVQSEMGHPLQAGDYSRQQEIAPIHQSPIFFNKAGRWMVCSISTCLNAALINM